MREFNTSHMVHNVKELVQFHWPDFLGSNRYNPFRIASGTG